MEAVTVCPRLIPCHPAGEWGSYRMGQNMQVIPLKPDIALAQTGTAQYGQRKVEPAAICESII